MNGQYKHDVFISFSFADQAIVETVANLLLSKHGITYWVCTQDIYGGEHYKEAIVDAIEAAKIFLLIQSESSVSSTEVPKEVDVALSCHKTVVPFVIDRSILMGDLRYDLSGIHRIDASRPTLEDRVAELAKHLHVLLKHPASAPTLRSGQGIATERLRSTPNVLPKKVFYGRDTVLDEIKGRFDAGERVLFLQGIGGIGKTQIVKQFAQRHQKDYDTIVYATYNGSLKELVLSDTYFDLEPEMNRRVLADGSLESDDDFFYRKLEKIKKLADERTLIIIDNFDVEGDEALATMMEGRYHLLFTT
ncbi:MAG: TIR domain-containing protein, partial [Clostridia bacterium]|nr:TIR domain-containing protein [Clostridia bacterium]